MALAVDGHGPPDAHRWTTANTGLALAAGLGMLEDWAQTQKFRRMGITEQNPILGRTPSAGRVNTLIGLGMLGALGGGALLPTKWRNRLWGTIAGGELAAVLHNAGNPAIGLALPFGPIR